jgi:hypothetical protein
MLFTGYVVLTGPILLLLMVLLSLPLVVPVLNVMTPSDVLVPLMAQYVIVLLEASLMNRNAAPEPAAVLEIANCEVVPDPPGLPSIMT